MKFTGEWTQDIPNEPGDYWFCGDPWRGQCGEDYYDDPPKVEPRIFFVQIHEISNGLMGETRGQFVYLRKFNKTRSEGVIGYWKKAEVPEIPFDRDNLFS